MSKITGLYPAVDSFWLLIAVRRYFLDRFLCLVDNYYIDNENRDAAMNYNRMTIRPAAEQFQVLSLTPSRTRVGTGYASTLNGWYVGRAARARFTGTYAECTAYIKAQGAEFMSEHDITC